MSTSVVIQQRGRLFREGLNWRLSDAPGVIVVGTAVTGEDLTRLCVERRPDLVILEVDIATWDPCRVAHRLQREVPGLRFLGTYADSCDEGRLERVRRAGLSVLVPHSRGMAGVVAGIEDALNNQPPRLGVVDMEVVRPFHLTAREIAILRLIGAGYTCREVSIRLGISSKTVENHKQRIFRKLGVQNQSHAVAAALQVDLIDSTYDMEVEDEPVASYRDRLRREPSGVEVVIAEDDALQRDLLVTACAARGIVVTACVATAKELLAAFDRHCPAVVVASDRLGHQRLDDVVNHILRKGGRLIVTTPDGSPERLTALLGRGVHGYMSREATPDEVVTGILAVARGAASIDHTAAAMMLQQWRGYRTRLSDRVDLGLGILTKREQDVLRAMSKGLATKAIALELGVAVKTVENHKIRVFEKLGVRTQAQAITVAMSFGLTEKESVRVGLVDRMAEPTGLRGAAG
jgi:DNA-binding NarL/FixJ family response regulator